MKNTLLPGLALIEAFSLLAQTSSRQFEEGIIIFSSGDTLQAGYQLKYAWGAAGCLKSRFLQSLIEGRLSLYKIRIAD